MAKRRCAFEGERFEASEFAEKDGFLVHMNGEAKPVEPIHEAIEGRLLRFANNRYVLATQLDLRTAIADNAP